MKKTLSLAAVAAILLAPVFANAASLADVGLTSYGNSAVTAPAVSGSLNVGISASASSTTTSSNGTASATAADNTGSNIDTNGLLGLSADTSGAVMLNLSRTQVTSDANTSSTASAMVSAYGNPASVSTNTNLNAFAHAVIMNDSNVSAVQSDNAHVTVWYKVPTHFLGFIRTDVNAQATTDANGNVSVHYPWYTFLSTKDSSANLKANLQAQVSGSASANGTLSAHDQAMLIDKMHTAFMNSTAASTSATANGSTGY